jgi:hypothetical protein
MNCGNFLSERFCLKINAQISIFIDFTPEPIGTTFGSFKERLKNLPLLA